MYASVFYKSRHHNFITPDKLLLFLRGVSGNIFPLSLNVIGTHLKGLTKMLVMSIHNIHFLGEKRKISILFLGKEAPYGVILNCLNSKTSQSMFEIQCSCERVVTFPMNFNFFYKMTHNCSNSQYFNHVLHCILQHTSLQQCSCQYL